MLSAGHTPEASALCDVDKVTSLYMHGETVESGDSGEHPVDSL